MVVSAIHSRPSPSAPSHETVEGSPKTVIAGK